MNVNKTMVISVVVGLASFGALIWGVSKLPNNAITKPVKEAAKVVS